MIEFRLKVKFEKLNYGKVAFYRILSFIYTLKMRLNSLIYVDLNKIDMHCTNVVLVPYFIVIFFLLFF